jgi:hypothetical protein
MPLQNRVTPFGEIVAIPERGTVMGNRGIIHDPATRTLLKKRWALKCWIICKLHYKHARREPMARRSWTELFFLDEATALAAGHRPCFFCNREKAEAFRTAWAQGGAAPHAPEIDAVLHRERLQHTAKRIHPMPAPLRKLPDGAMIAARDRAYLILGGRPLLWSPAGYRRGDDMPKPDGLLTPPSTVATLRAGYRPDLHPSAMA